MNGPGVLRMANSHVFSGYFKDGIFSQLGTYKSQNGESYFGFFEEGFRHGLGTQVHNEKTYLAKYENG